MPEDKAAAFRERAAELRAMAAKNRGSRMRGDLLRAAQEWDEIADRIVRDEKMESKTKRPE